MAALFVVSGGFQGVGAAAAKETAGPAAVPADYFAPTLVGQMRGFTFYEERLDPPLLGFVGADGETRELGEFKGKIVLVNFWALWCAPCLREMPSLDRLAAFAKDELGGEVVVVTINLDRGSADRPLAFLKKEGLSNVVFLHEPSFSAPQAFRLRGMPTTLMFDREGREIGVFTGEAEWDSAEARLLLERAAKFR